MASKINQVLTVLEKAGHLMGDANGLRDYHAAKNAVRALRFKDDYFAKVRLALKNYRVRVEPTQTGAQGKITVSTFDRSASVTL